MRWLWEPFSELQEALEENLSAGDPTVSAAWKSTLCPKQINDHVYEVYKPAGTPSVELVFFHGLQLESGSSEEAHINTWVSQDKAEWLTWLVEDFPESRILTISYDAVARTTKSEGRLDMYVTSENLVHSLTGDGARVGKDGRPVILVGHCLGGLVMKELCGQAFHMISLDNSLKAVENFLASVKGLFCYATPHHGCLLADLNKNSLKAPLIKVLRTLDVHTARKNEDFRRLRKSKGWKTFGVVGLLPVKLKLFEGVVVPEASARSDMDGFYAAETDHYNICRPVNKQSSTYQLLRDFARQIVNEWQQTQEEVHAKAIQDFPPSSGDEDNVSISELSPRQLRVLRIVRSLVFYVHIIMIFPLLGLVVVIKGVFNDKPLRKERSEFHKMDPGLLDFFEFTGTVFVVEILNLLLAHVTPLVVIYFLRFWMTRRWAHPLELDSELNFSYFGNLGFTQPSAPQHGELELDVGYIQEEDTRLDVGAQQEKDTNPGVGISWVESLLPKQQAESKSETQPLLPQSQVETKVDVDPLLVTSKQTRRLRSRGPNMSNTMDY